VDRTTHGTATVFEQIPSPSLQPFIERFLVVEFPSLHHDVHLPDTRAVAAFTFRGRVRLDGHQWAPAAAFTGPRDTSRGHEHCDGHAVLLATFTPAGASAFVHPPLDELAGTTTNLVDLLSGRDELDRLHDRLTGAVNHRRRVGLLEEFLRRRVRRSTPDPLVTAAIEWLEQRSGHARVDDLTCYIGLSQSALERRFRRVVGMSPKRFVSVMRLRKTVHLRSRGADFTQAALEAGYFDQSHFIHDFRRATGSSPQTFLQHTHDR
jgi:AraC-like DNA-binding protein